jgi:gamma-glutamyltranspeptidase/glutathione hydrolase
MGAAGGTKIIAQVAKALFGVIDWRLYAQQSLALPTMVALPTRVTVERGTALERMIPALRRYGHDPVPVAPGYKANAIERVNGRWVGAADPRSEGVALAE